VKVNFALFMVREGDGISWGAELYRLEGQSIRKQASIVVTFSILIYMQYKYLGASTGLRKDYTYTNHHTPPMLLNPCSLRKISIEELGARKAECTLDSNTNTPYNPSSLPEQLSRPSKPSQNTCKVLSYELPCLNPLV